MKIKETIPFAFYAFAGLASAQTSVTLFGVADAAFRSVSNQGVAPLNSLASGANSSSRIGFRGQEDLGAGLGVSFWLEAPVTMGTGGTTVMFSRRSTLSLFDKRWGELRAGRDFVPTHLNWARFDPFSYVGIAGVPNFLTSTATGPIRSAFSTTPNTISRASSSIQYFLPRDLNGIEGNLMVSSGESGATANDANKLLGARLGYTLGSLFVSAAAVTVENDLTRGQKFQDIAIGASYDFANVKITGAVRQFEFISAKQTNMLFSAVVKVGLGDIKISLNQTNMAGTVGATDIGADSATQIGLGYVYNLTKRSALYGTLAVIDNKGKSAFTVPGGSAGITAGGTSRGFEVGLRHDF
jgi:predicted porin